MEMTTASMHHDLLDRAFVKRLRESNLSAAAPMPRDVATSPSATTSDATRSPESPAAPRPQTAPIPAENVAGSVLDRLIETVPAQWSAVADAVEQAITDRGGSDRAGFVVAAVSRRAKDGCTTFVDGLARTLRDRGTDVRTTTFDSIDRDCEAVQIVDAGSWFGSGPIRRERAMTLADGCDAAILLRRADRSSAAAFARALEVAGVRVLGEVTTFGRGPDATPEDPA